jgi:hypothetical protein
MTAVKEVVTYMGTFNLVVFLSLKTFRQSSCAFYLTVMSFVNIGQLSTGQFSRLMITGYGIDWTQTSLPYCKFRWYSFQIFTYVSVTCVCLATIDQFFATCDRVRWQQWSNIKLAQRLIVVSVIFWIIYDIPYLIFYNHVVSATTGVISCVNSNTIFLKYHAYMGGLILSGGLPLLVTFVFGMLAFKNVRQLAYRTVPLVRRELDKQLTNMVLIQVVFSFFAFLPYTIAAVLPFVTNLNSDPITSAELNLATNTCGHIYYMYFAVSINLKY